MTNIEKVINYLNKASVFYVTTIDGNKPKCRPFSFKMEHNGTIYFGAGTFKDVYRQLQSNPNIEICASHGGGFMRYYGKASFVSDSNLEAYALASLPMLNDIYNDETGYHLGMFFIDDAVVEFRSLQGIEETFTL